MRTSTARLVALVVAAVALTGCGAGRDKAGGKKPVSVRVLHVLNTRGGEEIAPFVDRLAELAGGALALDVENKWERQNPSADADAIRALQAGKADVAVVPARAWHTAGVTAFDALIAPFAIDSLALQAKVLSSDIPAKMVPAVAKVGLTGIGLLPGPLRRPTGITRSFRSPADFAGARIGYFASAVAEKTLQTLGAAPVRWAAEGTSVAGMDGVEIQVTAVPQYVHVMHSVTANVALWPRPNVLVATPRAWRSLSDQQRGWLRSAVHDAVDPTVQSLRHIDEDLGALCRSGLQFVTATAEEVTALRTAIRPVETWLRRDPQTAHYLDDIGALRAGVTPYPDEQPNCAGFAGTTAAARARTPFDGTYGVVNHARCPDDCGTYVFVFDRGHFASTKENGAACGSEYGTYTVNGDTVEWTLSTGELYVWKWSLYKDRLTLTPVSPADLPGYPPWRRLSAQPDPSYLSKRCPPPADALPR
jgi:TRAP-type transport system periplasmic protein